MSYHLVVEHKIGSYSVSFVILVCLGETISFTGRFNTFRADDFGKQTILRTSDSSYAAEVRKRGAVHNRQKSACSQYSSVL